MPVIRMRVSNFLAFVLIACGSTLMSGCPSSIYGPSDNGSNDSQKFSLTVLERSATSLKLQWDPIPVTNGDGYTVDYLTGYTTCGVQVATHNNVLEVGNVTTVNVIGLSPSTDYHIHVHPLIGHLAQSGRSTSVFVRTLAPGAAAQPVAAADYQRC